MDYARPALADALAAQYVAGTLRGRARNRFEALLPSHPALRAAVRDWQDRLMPLTDVVKEQPPPSHVWQGIQRKLWPEPAPVSMWQRMNVWRALSGIALAAVVGLAVLVAMPQPAQPPVVVVLQPTGNHPAVAGGIVASFSSDGQALVARPLTPVALTPDRVMELWWATEKGAPVSLGLMKPDGVTVLRRGQLPGGLRGSQIDHMAVSLEPPGGSPTGKPTGPVVALGKLQL